MDGGSDGVYDFKDNKTNGTVTVTKEWNDKKANEERPEPEIKVSTKKPGKNPLGYTITFHGNEKNRLSFADGSYVNEIVCNSSGSIVSGNFKIPGRGEAPIGWYADTGYKNKVEVNESGLPTSGLTGDIDLYAKNMTFEIKGYSRIYVNDFNDMIPNTVTSVVFTDEIKPVSESIIDVDADGDGGVVAWTENNGTVMKVSTQIKGIKVQAAEKSGYMFYYRNNIKSIDLTNFDTANVTDMQYMFYCCLGLTSLDLTSLNTANVTNMGTMFYNCSSLTSLDLTSFNTTKVTDMGSMFSGCSGLTSLDLTPLSTTNVTNMKYMFAGCSDLTSLDLAPLSTANVTDMSYMFCGCSGLTSLDLTPLDTANVTDMKSMFYGCSGLTSLDLTSFNTAKVTNMNDMFHGCYNLTTLTIGTTFKFVKTSYRLPGTWRNTAGETFTSGTFPSNVADTYTKI